MPAVPAHGHPTFDRTINSIVANQPARIIISTYGQENLDAANRYVAWKAAQWSPDFFRVVAVTTEERRAQFIEASNRVRTPIIAYVDEKAIWGPGFLGATLPEFDDPFVGVVGTVKHVEQNRGTTITARLLNFLASTYVERQNYELTSTYNIDGGVSLISSVTGLMRTKIAHVPNFRTSFLEETYTNIPLPRDEDHFITRYAIDNDWKTVFHNSEAGAVWTSMGANDDWAYFIREIAASTRAALRSNLKSLVVSRKCWRKLPWTTYASFLSSLWQFSVFWDPVLLFTLYRSGHSNTTILGSATYFTTTLALLIFSKYFDVSPRYYLDHAAATDIVFILSQALFEIVVSGIKLNALFTIRDTTVPVGPAPPPAPAPAAVIPTPPASPATTTGMPTPPGTPPPPPPPPPPPQTFWETCVVN